MTADSKMPERKLGWIGTRDGNNDYVSLPYVEWLESRLARTEAALKVAKELLDPFYDLPHQRDQVRWEAERVRLFAMIAALEWKP